MYYSTTDVSYPLLNLINNDNITNVKAHVRCLI